MNKEKEIQLVNNILDYYEFKLRDDGALFLGQTGTPSFHILIHNKRTPNEDYKSLPHGKGGCSLTLGLETVEFTFDGLYDLLMPYIGDDNILEKWNLKKEAEKNIAQLSEEFLNKKGFLFIEGIMDGNREDIIRILEEKQKSHFNDLIKDRNEMDETFTLEANNEYLYVFTERQGIEPYLTNVIITNKKQSKEEIDLTTYDYYKYLDDIVEKNRAFHEKKKFQSLPTAIQDELL